MNLVETLIERDRLRQERAEMLAALKSVDLMFSEPRKYNKRMILNRVRELIAKAEGGAAS
jgi:hypothetical protein